MRQDIPRDRQAERLRVMVNCPSCGGSQFETPAEVTNQISERLMCLECGLVCTVNDGPESTGWKMSLAEWRTHFPYD
jgi:transcription elongation factor Elf1